MLCERLFVLINMPAFHVETLLPLMLYSIKRMSAERSVLYGTMASVIGGVQFLGGMPYSSFTFAIIASTFFLLTVYVQRLKSERGRYFRSFNVFSHFGHLRLSA